MTSISLCTDAHVQHLSDSGWTTATGSIVRMPPVHCAIFPLPRSPTGRACTERIHQQVCGASRDAHLGVISVPTCNESSSCAANELRRALFCSGQLVLNSTLASDLRSPAPLTQRSRSQRGFCRDVHSLTLLGIAMASTACCAAKKMESTQLSTKTS